MIDITNKQRGNCGLGIAIGYFSTHGYTVSIPLNDTQDYDLLVDKDKQIKSVQVKYTTCKTKYGNYQVALKSCGGTKGTTYKTVIDTNVDYLFIATDKIDMYLIPIKEVTNKSTLNLCEKYEKYKLNWFNQQTLPLEVLPSDRTTNNNIMEKRIKQKQISRDL